MIEQLNNIHCFFWVILIYLIVVQDDSKEYIYIYISFVKIVPGFSFSNSSPCGQKKKKKEILEGIITHIHIHTQDFYFCFFVHTLLLLTYRVVFNLQSHQPQPSININGLLNSHFYLYQFIKSRCISSSSSPPPSCLPLEPLWSLLMRAPKEARQSKTAYRTTTYRPNQSFPAPGTNTCTPRTTSRPSLPCQSFARSGTFRVYHLALLLPPPRMSASEKRGK
ncbi:hypothetical protein QBC43DRAFT_319326 [Cladorrhinum sp. PSN259]|nr:hypothetical protein QBC43DRAFT_319326 [Cladorrhinum sp. PSN259]